MKLCCLDFETANARRESACSVGLSVLQGGMVIETAEQLLHPPRGADYFSSFNVMIHGIRPRDVADEPEFDAMAPWIYERLNADLVIAHNAAFDLSVLRALCEYYALPCPEFRYFCTCKAARRLWKNLPNHKLDTLCAHIGHTFRHHNAAADAEAAGRVFLAMQRETGTTTAEALADELGIELGYLSATEHHPCRVRKR